MYLPSLVSHFTWNANINPTCLMHDMRTHHLIARLEARECHRGNRVLLMKGLIGGYDRRVCRERKVNTWESMKNIRGK